MKIYKLGAEFNNATHFMYKWCNKGFERDRDFLLRFAIDNKSLTKHLTDATCEKIVDETSNTKANFARFMGASVNFIIDEKTKTVLEANISEAVEFIPIKCENETMYLFYVMEHANYDYNNIVRETKTILMQTKSGKPAPVKMPLRVKKFAFKEEDIQGKNIFHPILDGSHKPEIFVTEEFINLIKDNGLTGFKFTEVWDSEAKNDTK